MTETEQANHIERADIGEANISTLNVSDLQWEGIETLAAITSELEAMRDQDNKLIEAINSASHQHSLTSQQEAKSGPTYGYIGTTFDETGSIKSLSEIEAAQKRNEKGPDRPQNEKSGTTIPSSQLLEISIKAPEITILAPDLAQNKNHLVSKGTTTPPGRARHKKDDNPVKSRKDRTIEITENPATRPTSQPEQPARAVVESRGTTVEHKSAIAEPSKAAGFYLGDDGRVRRPDGTFANRVEVHRFNHEQNANTARQQGEAADPRLPQLIAKSLGMLATMGGKTASGAGEQAGTVAGVATGGSIFLAAKEVSELASDVKESAKERGISSIRDIAPYLKRQLGFADNPADQATHGTPGKRRPPKQLAPGEAPRRLASADAQLQEGRVDRGSRSRRQSRRGEAASNPAEQEALAQAGSRPGDQPSYQEKEQRVEVASHLHPANAPRPVDAAIVNQQQASSSQAYQQVQVRSEPSKPQPDSVTDSQAKQQAQGPAADRQVDINVRQREQVTRTGSGEANQRQWPSASAASPESTPPKPVHDTKLQQEGPSASPLQGTQQGSFQVAAPAAGYPSVQPLSVTAEEQRQQGKPLQAGIAQAHPQEKQAGMAKSAIASQQDKQTIQLKAASDSQLKQAEEQHQEVIKKLEEVIEAVKPKGPTMLDSAFDMASDRYRRRGRGGKGKSRSPRSRPAAASARRTRAGAGRWSGPSRTGRADADFPRRTPKPSVVRAGMGKALPSLPAVSTAAGRTAGAAVKGGAALGGAAVGRLAGAGAKAIPLVGQAITLGLAAYDAYDGYNDKGAQAQAFGLKEGKEASTSQKSAMAAARALDLGGITSGFAGLVGSAAGAMGFQKIQDAMTFDTDDMARAIYEGMTLFNRRNPETTTRGGDLTINQLGGGVTPRGITPMTGDWKGTPLKFNGTEAENGLPQGYLANTVTVESGGDPNARNKSGAAGLYQFMPKTAAGLNLMNPFDPVEATQAMITHTKNNQAYFQSVMGRAPEGRELYLMHQQGMAGGTKLLKNPMARATDLVGAGAVLQNGGRVDMTSQEFTNMVLAKYDKAEAFNKANPGKAIDMDKLVGTKPKYEAPMMLRGGPRQDELPQPLLPPAPKLPTGSLQQPEGAAPGKSAPDQIAPGSTAPTAIRGSTSTTRAAPPPMLMPVSDIQSIAVRNDQREKDKKPYAPGADTDAAMLAVLKSMDKSLKDMGKDKARAPQAGGPVRPGGKPPIGGHPALPGSAADFANDRR